MTKPEVKLLLRLQNDQLGYRFKRQFAFGPYILDFYCAELKVDIEIDGKDHLLRRHKDAERDDWLRRNGVVVYRIPARAIYKDLDGVINRLKEFLDEIRESKQD